MRSSWLVVLLIVGIPTCGVSADKSRRVDFSREVFTDPVGQVLCLPRAGR